MKDKQFFGTQATTVQFTDKRVPLHIRAETYGSDDPLWLAYSVSPRPHWDWEIIVCGAAPVVVLVSAFGALYFSAFSEAKRREREAACEQRGGIPVGNPPATL